MHGWKDSRLRPALWYARALTVATLGWCLSLYAMSAHAQQSSERHRPNSSVRSVREANKPVRVSQPPAVRPGVVRPGGFGSGQPTYRVAAQPQANLSTDQNPNSQPVLVPPGGIEAAQSPAANSEGSVGARQFRVPLQEPDFQNMRIKAEDGMLSLVVRDAPLRDVLTLLAETHGLNIVTADPLTQPISVTLERVKLNDALDAILSIAGYTFAINRNIILVSNLNSATTLAPQAQGLRLEVFQLDFAMAQDVNTAVTGMLSPIGQAYVIASSPTENRRPREIIAVNDLPQFLDRIRQYIAQIDIPPRQVLIEAHVLQVDLNDENKHGVNFSQLFDRSQSEPLIQVQSSGMASVAPGAQAFTFRFSDGNLLAIIEMLRTTQDAKTLASPKILVLNGQQARLQVGQQLGFRVTTTTETSTTEGVDWLDVGVVLEVTPHISRDGKVMMSVRPEVSSGEVNPTTGLPEEETTELETDILLCDNEGIVIGGLIQETDNNNQSKLAWLGDIYLVGKLFQRREVTKERKEIIIALIPRVLPYEPTYEAIAAEQFAHTDVPLFYGPLCRVPRPWEPQLPDVVNNPSLPRIRDIFPRWRCDGCGQWTQYEHCPNCHNPFKPDATIGAGDPNALPGAPNAPSGTPESLPETPYSLPGSPNSPSGSLPGTPDSLPPPVSQDDSQRVDAFPDPSYFDSPTINAENSSAPPGPHTTRLPPIAASPPAGRITGMTVKTRSNRLQPSQQFGPNPTRIAQPPSQSVIR